MEKFFLSLLIFIPLAAVANTGVLSPVFVFFFSALAIIPLAKLMGEATEELAARVGAAWGSLVNVTFGNATELIIGIFALRAGLIEVVKASITGSIIGNLLFVLGTAILVGGTRFKTQTFNKTAAQASGSTLFLAVVALIVPAMLPAGAFSTNPEDVHGLSLIVAACMMLMYLGTLFFSLYTHKYLYAGQKSEMPMRWSVKKSIFVLLFVTAGVAWMSDILVNTINPIAHSLGWNELFIGVVIVAIVGNAAEHTTAIVMAIKNEMDLALQIAIGSATQIAMFVAPVLVFVSLLFPLHMDLIFHTFELACILLSIVIANMVISDGESNWLEGAQLLIAYAIMAIAFFVHP